MDNTKTCPEDRGGFFDFLVSSNRQVDVWENSESHLWFPKGRFDTSYGRDWVKLGGRQKNRRQSIGVSKGHRYIGLTITRQTVDLTSLGTRGWSSAVQINEELLSLGPTNVSRNTGDLDPVTGHVTSRAFTTNSLTDTSSMRVSRRGLGKWQRHVWSRTPWDKGWSDRDVKK